MVSIVIEEDQRRSERVVVPLLSGWRLRVEIVLGILHHGGHGLSRLEQPARTLMPRLLVGRLRSLRPVAFRPAELFVVGILAIGDQVLGSESQMFDQLPGCMERIIDSTTSESSREAVQGSAHTYVTVALAQ